jgi:hypothetical protein
VKVRINRELYPGKADDIFYDDFWDSLLDGSGKTWDGYKQDKLLKIPWELKE